MIFLHSLVSYSSSYHIIIIIIFQFDRQFKMWLWKMCWSVCAQWYWHQDMYSYLSIYKSIYYICMQFVRSWNVYIYSYIRYNNNNVCAWSVRSKCYRSENSCQCSRIIINIILLYWNEVLYTCIYIWKMWLSFLFLILHCCFLLLLLVNYISIQYCISKAQTQLSHIQPPFRFNIYPIHIYLYIECRICTYWKVANKINCNDRESRDLGGDSYEKKNKKSSCKQLFLFVIYYVVEWFWLVIIHYISYHIISYHAWYTTETAQMLCILWSNGLTAYLSVAIAQAFLISDGDNFLIAFLFFVLDLMNYNVYMCMCRYILQNKCNKSNRHFNIINNNNWMWWQSHAT